MSKSQLKNKKNNPLNKSANRNQKISLNLIKNQNPKFLNTCKNKTGLTIC